MVNRIGVVITGILCIVLTYLAPQGMLNHIAYIGTGGLISMFVGPIIMRTIVKANITAALSSMVVGFVLSTIFILKFKVGWVEAPIISGLCGSIVYLVVGFIGNGMKRFPEEETN